MSLLVPHYSKNRVILKEATTSQSWNQWSFSIMHSAETRCFVHGPPDLPPSTLSFPSHPGVFCVYLYHCWTQWISAECISSFSGS